MGRARVELEPLMNQRLRKWFPLSADSEGKKCSSNVRVRRLVVSSTCVDGVERVSVPPLPRLREGASNPAPGGESHLTPSTRVPQVTGDLELVVQWRHNPALAFAPFSDEVEVPEGKKPNELRVAAIQARRLAVKDQSMMGKGSSDPVVTFELGSVKAETTVKKKTLTQCRNQIVAARGASRQDPNSVVALRTG